ncbi:MAG: hypothetical protein OEW15_11525 [Nitrospirota bacterium]|nr:hypothetical protein [Nitrospirota bacterium]
MTYKDPATHQIVLWWEGEAYVAKLNQKMETDFVSFLNDIGEAGRRDLWSVLRINHGSELLLTKEKTVNPYQEIFEEIEAEAVTGREKYGAFNSAHEGFAVLQEEVDELKQHVWTNQSKRDLGGMKKEAMQVAAMAVRFAAECCSEERGRR